MTASVLQCRHARRHRQHRRQRAECRHRGARQLDRHAHRRRQLSASRERHLPRRGQRRGPERPDQRRRHGQRCRAARSASMPSRASTFAPRTTYTILNAAGGLSGTFASVNELYPFLLSSLSYDANNVYLTLQIGGFAAAAQTPTQYAVGSVLDANVANATGDFATVLGSAGHRCGTAQAPGVRCTALQRPQLRRLLDLDGPGRPALHEQLRQPDRRRRFARRQPRGPGRGLRRRLRRTAPAEVGRLGRRAGRSRHDRRQPAGRRRHLQCRRLRRRPRPAITDSFAHRRHRGLHHRHAVGLGLRRPGPHRHLPGRPLRRLRPGQGLCRRPGRATPTATTRCGAASRSPACRCAPPRASTGANQFYGQLETGYRFDLGTDRRRLRHAVRPPAGLHRHAERLHRDRRAVAQPHASRSRPPTRCARCSAPSSAARWISAGARSSRCSSGWAGATSTPTPAGR